MKLIEKIDRILSEANVMFYNHGRPASQTWDELEIRDVPALLRSVGMGARRISLESEGDRNTLNKVLKSGKTVYVAINPFHLQVSGQTQLLWFTNQGKLVNTYLDLMKEV